MKRIRIFYESAILNETKKLSVEVFISKLHGELMDIFRLFLCLIFIEILFILSCRLYTCFLHQRKLLNIKVISSHYISVQNFLFQSQIELIKENCITFWISYARLFMIPLLVLINSCMDVLENDFKAWNFSELAINNISPIK